MTRSESENVSEIRMIIAQLLVGLVTVRVLLTSCRKISRDLVFLGIGLLHYPVFCEGCQHAYRVQAKQSSMALVKVRRLCVDLCGDDAPGLNEELTDGPGGGTFGEATMAGHLPAASHDEAWVAGSGNQATAHHASVPTGGGEDYDETHNDKTETAHHGEHPLLPPVRQDRYSW